MKAALPYLALAAAVTLLTLASAPSSAPPPPAPMPSPAERQDHARPPDQTFLTFPEWYLVFSPREYAEHIARDRPSRFPFIGHLGQLWGSYALTSQAVAARGAPFNFEYHLMIWVIGVSTTAEYLIRWTYENSIGRATELAGEPTAEDRYAVRCARAYVDFLDTAPFYEYSYAADLKGLWTETPLWGPNMARKWERRYVLTTELGIKAAYATLIEKANRSSYAVPAPTTEAVLIGAPAELPADVQVLERREDGSVRALLPRYQTFTARAIALARAGAEFRSIAGNEEAILVSALGPPSWRGPATEGCVVLFRQPLLTDPSRARLAIVAPVARLSALLLEIEDGGRRVEHIFDY